MSRAEFDLLKTILLLSFCFALTGSTSSLTVSASPLVGFQIADNKALATLPLAFHLIGTMLAGIPASFLMKRVGRRYGFMIGTGIGSIGAVSAALSIIYFNFTFFCLSIFCLGILSGFAQLYRFAAADVATKEFRTKAVSLVMFGGIVAGFIGPTVASKAKDLIPNAQFAGSYLFVILFHFLIFSILLRTRLPRPSAVEITGETRPLKEIFSQPKFIVAALSSMVGYGVMAMIMTATPLAMTEGSGHPFSDAAFVIQWHVVGMFAPSVFTGSLIHRFGSVPIIFTGILLNILCIGINISATTESFSFVIKLKLALPLYCISRRFFKFFKPNPTLLSVLITPGFSTVIQILASCLFISKKTTPPPTFKSIPCFMAFSTNN